MKFAITHGNFGPFAEPDAALDLARRAEAAGFESLWTIEHVVVPTSYEPNYPETADGRFWFDATTALPDPIVWMSFVAARTSQIRLGTAVAILPQRNPLIAAKEIATLDRLSGGRIEFGVGTGWLREEFEALGVPFAERGRRLDESIALIRQLWQPGEHEFDGAFWRFDAVHLEPSPVGGTVPIHIGGASPVAARRAGRLGDGFFPGGYDRALLRGLISLARETYRDAGRTGQLEITARWTRDPDQLFDVAAVRDLEEWGVDRIAVPAAVLLQNGLARTLDRLGAEVIPELAAPRQEIPS